MNFHPATKRYKSDKNIKYAGFGTNSFNTHGCLKRSTQVQLKLLDNFYV